MASVNRLIVAGNLTADVQLKSLPSGTSVAEIRLAINNRVKKGDSYVDETVYLDCNTFGRTAEIAAQYLAKGSPVLLEGRLKQDNWEKDGVKHSKHRMFVENLHLIGAKKSEGSGGGGSYDRQPATSGVGDRSALKGAVPDGDYDDIPF